MQPVAGDGPELVRCLVVWRLVSQTAGVGTVLIRRSDRQAAELQAPRWLVKLPSGAGPISFRCWSQRWRQ
jgi:hypothetical protein